MTPKQKYYENLADSLIEKFGLRQIEAYYASDRKEACQKACRYLSPGCSVAWGGSVTLNEIGLIDAIKASDCTVYDRFAVNTPEEKREMFGRIATCDYYFMSSNAITLDGQLVNIDGNGNRVASLIHGPQNVIVIAGMNTEKIGLASVELGAGRKKLNDDIDYSAGIIVEKKTGEAVKKGDCLAVLHTSDKAKLSEGARLYLNALNIE